MPEPKSAKNGLHIDLWAADVPAEVERLRGIGVNYKATYDGWIVLTNPEGNEFCVCRTDASEA